jgi:hypothetical protein
VRWVAAAANGGVAQPAPCIAFPFICLKVLLL